MVNMQVGKEQVIDLHRVDPDQHQVFQDPAAAIELQYRAVDDDSATCATAQRVRQCRTRTGDNQLHSLFFQVRERIGRQACGSPVTGSRVGLVHSDC